MSTFEAEYDDYVGLLEHALQDEHYPHKWRVFRYAEMKRWYGEYEADHFIQCELLNYRRRITVEQGRQMVARAAAKMILHTYKAHLLSRETTP